jgi:FKBP-type peptidyl-prolyl cis-trans isomerase 2
MVSVQKNDFVELEFTAVVKDSGEIFDTTNSENAKKMGMKNPETVKPVIISIENKMTLPGLDQDLSGKEIGKEYTLDVQPEKAFGKRNPSMIRMIPLKAFIEQKIMPQRGMQLALDGTVVKIISVSGGRVLADFNSPLAGKVVTYKYKMLRKVEDQKEKVDALQEFLFRKKFEYTIADKKITFQVNKGLKKVIEMIGKPFQQILDLTVEAEEIEKKKE